MSSVITLFSFDVVMAFFMIGLGAIMAGPKGGSKEVVPLHSFVAGAIISITGVATLVIQI